MARVKKSDLIPLSEGELAALIKHPGGGVVHTTYPGGDLIVGPRTRWCLPVLADMRGVSISPALRTSLRTSIPASDAKH